MALGQRRTNRIACTLVGERSLQHSDHILVASGGSFNLALPLFTIRLNLPPTPIKRVEPLIKFGFGDFILDLFSRRRKLLGIHWKDLKYSALESGRALAVRVARLTPGPSALHSTFWVESRSREFLAILSHGMAEGCVASGNPMF